MGLLGFLAATAYWPGIASAAFVPRWVIIAVGLPIVFRLDPRDAGWIMGVTLAELVALSALSLRLSPDPMGGTLDLFYIVLLCGVFFAGAGIGSADAAMRGMGWGIVLQAPLAVAQWYGFDWLPHGSPFPAGLFYTSECYAELAAIVLPWAIVKREWSIVAGSLLPLALCHSRIAIAVVLLSLCWVMPMPRRWLKPALLSLALVLGIASLFVLGVPKIASAGQRIVLWGATIMGLSYEGHGLGWFYRAHPIEQFAHSDALQAVAEIGPVALALVSIPWMAWRRRRRGSRAERAAFVAVCIEVLVSFPLHFPATGFLAALLAGRLAGVGPRLRGAASLGGGHHDARLQWA